MQPAILNRQSPCLQRLSASRLLSPPARHPLRCRSGEMSQPQKLKLCYFDVPGRAETTRIMLHYAGIPFEDFRFKEQDWPALKPKTPFGQVPVLHVDDMTLAQSKAIERYVAKMAGLIPTDPWAAAKVDEAVALVDEVNDALAATLYIDDPNVRMKKREELLQTTVKTRFHDLIRVLKDAGGEFLVGNLTNDKPTYADIYLYKSLSAMMGGTIEGVPANLITDSYPDLCKFHCRVAALPPIFKLYEKETSGPAAAYKVVGPTH